MFEKNLKYAYLLDFYGSLLDEHARSIMTAYYDDDLSLSEVAEGVGISRQGVRHIIKRAEEQLDFYEERLMLAASYERSREAEGALREIIEVISSFSDSIPNECIEKISKIKERYLKEEQLT